MSDHHNHDHHDHSDHVGQFRRMFWVMLVFAVPVVAFNQMFVDLLGYTLPDAEWVWWVSPLLGSVMYVWGGRPFLTGAVDELRSRAPGMMLLIGLA
ncbi:MAG: heavy metal translocating P-type ATPase, partial [Nesterenkonia sp.]